MPELPEIHNFARTIQAQATRTFKRIEQPRILGKWPEIDVHKSISSVGFTVAAVARGKELQLTIRPALGAEHTFVFNHGLEGRWVWYPNAHAKPSQSAMLEFYSEDGGCLCMVDSMRMASWHPGTFDPRTRGPDPLTDLASFVANIRKSVQHKDFKQPIGELLLNQQYFNGIGNYLRAEILARAGVAPQLTANELFSQPQYKEKSDVVLALCHAIPQEVLDLGLNKYGTPEEKRKFQEWLTCYGKSNSEKDKRGRTIWFLPNQASRQPSPKDVEYARTLLANNGTASPSNSNTTTTTTTSGDMLTSVAASVDKPEPSAPPTGASLGAPLMRGRGAYPEKTKLLLLISILFKENKINGTEKNRLKELVISGQATGKQAWLPKLVSCLEYFEAENDLDEVGETLHILSRYL